MSNEAIEIDEDDASIDEEQLEEYQEMLDQLGSFPDKIKINSLTMVAEDHAGSHLSAKAIYEAIRNRLLHTNRDNILPLVYVLDSILKNAKGNYVAIVEKDAASWMPTIHQQLQEPQRQKLEKVWRTWEEFHIFSETAWKAMGKCFDNTSNTTSEHLQVAGINRTKDGTLLLTKTLRAEMQSILDDLQNETHNELEKVSLERLAEINPDLLAQIKETALESLHSQNANTRTSGDSVEIATSLPFFTETRSKEALERSKAWAELKWDYKEHTYDVVNKLQHLLRESVTPDKRYTQKEALDMTRYLSVASATAEILTNGLERIQNQADQRNHKTASFPGTNVATVTVSSRGLHIDKKNFTNDGIKKKDSAVISLLYEAGLPFVSSADGRRFATQLELSNHLDALFKKNQLEKTIASTEERGWYIVDLVWTKENRAEDMATEIISGSTSAPTNDANESFNPNDNMVPADESRDRCVICGINFKMIFDNDEGVYMYCNCREIEVLNDDEVALNESEQMLVHATCWKGLGSPDVLTADQALQEVFH